MNETETWRERVRDIRASRTTWWWWWWRLPQQVFWIWHKTIWWRGSSNAGALGNAEYFFIAIAPKSTLAWSVSTWRVLSLGQIELNCVLMLNWNVYMNKNGFGINSLLYLICHKSKRNQTFYLGWLSYWRKRILSALQILPLAGKRNVTFPGASHKQKTQTYIYICVHSISFQSFLYRHLKLS